MSETRHEHIADELTTDILRGRYRVGERLPSERDLAARYGVNRGAVREAIKKLEQLGLATVQPGGARVMPIEDSSLDVVGHLLALDDLPDPDLVEQVLTVMSALMKTAAEQALVRASDHEIDQARDLIRRLGDRSLDQEARIQTRLELGRQFMRMSGNLVLGLIARSLRVQVLGNAQRALDYIHAPADQEIFLTRMDTALSSRDVDAAVATLQALADLNREQVVDALRSAHAERNGGRKYAT